MPNSLRCMLSKLRHKGQISDAEYKELITKLENHDKVIKEQTNTAKYIHIDDVYRLVAGHSDYHGDSILSAFTCITEGKNVKNITPLEKQTNTAEWIIGSYEVKCSNCGYLAWGSELNTYKEWKFCPNCGRKIAE